MSAASLMREALATPPAAAVQLAAWVAAAPTVVPALSALMACVSGALALPMLLEAYQSRARRALFKQRALDGQLTDSLGRDAARNGLPLLSRPARLLGRAPYWRDASLSVWRLLDALGYPSSPATVLELMLALSLLAGLALLALSGQAWMGLLAAAALPLAAKGYADGRLEQRSQLMREQLPDALQCLGFCFLAGCSLQQAVEQTAGETPEPLRAELVRLSDDLQSGLRVDEALAALEERSSLPEMGFMAVALEIQHTTGGSLRDILEAAAESVRGAVALKRQLKVQTAQARLSFKVVALMPVALVGVLSLCMEGYLESFFASAAGMLVLASALAMEAAGILLIRRILGVDVG